MARTSSAQYASRTRLSARWRSVARPTVAAAQAARGSGVIEADDEVVVLLTGNGLKTPDARTFGLAEDAAGARRARAGEPGLAPVLPPSLSAFEGWLQA